jgi:predicted nucleic acid-binding Zn ribbon protein
MEQTIKEKLSGLGPKARKKALEGIPGAEEYLDKQYPGVERVYQLHAVLHGKSPYCSVCGNPVKNLGKATCGVACREIKAKGLQSQRAEKRKQTMIARYGVDNPRHIEGTEEKRKRSMLERHGGLVSELARRKTTERAENLNMKARETIMKRYGVSNASQIPGHSERVKQTLIQNYGVDHYSKTQEFLDRQLTKRASKITELSNNTVKVKNIFELENTEFDNPNYRIEFECSCGRATTVPYETFKWRCSNLGTACPVCAGIKQGSKAQQEITEYVKQFCPGVLTNDRIILSGKELDIVIPSKKLAIEYHGLYWHNDLRVGRRYHSEKLALAERAGYRLIQIFEDEWVSKQNIVKSRLRNQLGSIEKRIAARKCSIGKVSAAQEKTFLLDNHIQGYAKSSVKLGLFYCGELVSLMTFSRLSRAKGHRSAKGKWELLRFCNALDTIVVGAASRLLKYFYKNTSVDEIISFADKRWSTGDLYHTLGFVRHSDTRENYWYVDLKDLKRIHRFALRKTASDNSELTEYENRLLQGYLRIWDCGSSKWIWTPEMCDQERRKQSAGN